MSSVTPVISVSQDLDSGLWELYASSYNSTTVAGPRLFRAPPWPEIAFSHQDQASAERDAQTLRGYLESLGRGPSKAKLRKIGAD